MGDILIAMDCMSIIVSLIILYASYFKVQQRSYKNWAYMLFVGINTLILIADMLSWMINGNIELTLLNMFLNTMTFSLCFAEGYFFAEYMVMHISESCKVPAWCTRVYKQYFFAASIITIILGLNGNFFDVKDGWYVEGPDINIYFILGLGAIVYLIILLLKYGKNSGVHDNIAMMSYLLLPTAAVISSVTLKGIYLFYPATTISGLLIYVMLQVEQQNVLYEKSNIDELTGFYNRRAYEEELKLYQSTYIENDLVLVAMDVNGLKMVNDNEGHVAGDELIRGAARCMRRCFGNNGKVFRIGGDEFVAILFTDERQLKIIKEDFETTVFHWSGKLVQQLSISCGYVAKMEFPEKQLTELIEIADDRMYKAKEDYYRNKGIDHRGQQTALSAISNYYTKILRVNLSKDSYCILRMDEKEKKLSSVFSESLSEIVRLGQIHHEDQKEYLTYANKEYIQDYFKTGKDLFSISYRRTIDGAFKRVVMEIIPTPDYCKENQTVFLYIKNIDTL